MTRLYALLISGTFLFFGCGDHHEEDAGQDQEAQHSHAEGSHGGSVMVIGDHLGHVEIVHHEGEGEVDLFFTGADAKTAMALSEAPKLNLVLNDGNKQIGTTAMPDESGRFNAKDDALKVHLIEGRIALKLEGKPYSVAIEIIHDHEH